MAIVLVVTRSPGWHEFKSYFFDWTRYGDSFPEIGSAFFLNVKIFLIAEAIILVTALALAVIRSLPGPVFFPLRALAIVYVDLFRGIPLILVIFMIGFGIRGLGLGWISDRSPFFYGVAAIVIVYSAYVAEVYRAGIESIQIGRAHV